MTVQVLVGLSVCVSPIITLFFMTVARPILKMLDLLKFFLHRIFISSLLTTNVATIINIHLLCKIKRNFTKCLKNQPSCDVIKMRDYPSVFQGFSFPLLFLSLILMTSHSCFLRHFVKLQSNSPLDFQKISFR